MPITIKKLAWVLGALSGVLLLASASLQEANAAQTDVLSIDKAMDRAFESNPDLAAARWEIDIAQGGRQQAGLIPNPVLSSSVEDTRRNKSATSTKLSQTLELGGKRGARIEVASRAQDAASLELERRSNGLRADVIEAFYGALRAQERTQLAGRSQSLAERGLTVAKGRVTAGKASPLEATRAEVQLSQIRLELNRAQVDQDNAYRRLAQVIGVASPDFSAVQEQPSPLPVLPASAQLLARLKETADLRLAEMQIVQREASLGLEKTQRIPDLTVSIGSKYDNTARDGRGERTNLVDFSLPLPLFNRNQGNILSAARRADQALDLRNATELRLRTETRQAVDLWTTANNEVKSFNQVILPAAQVAVDNATRGFEMGKFNFLDVLDAQRTLVNARTQYLAALAQSTDAWVRIERIYGDLAGVAQSL